ncbi:conserved hypothetical protein [Crenothrix polyspora]|uniref:Uncharacterized protein n=1 Tax=Crenothrix polyspora TaxID=360316 RepID=A0A1R4HB96_9GAMM|nr:hypothetical protein [Crenothrix polyspora]SJM93532.1 conserved hypothetical protein [Crenothrix polyspora]
MSHSKQQSEVQEAESKADKLSRRRRAFIKGSAAVLPVVLTLRNGSAFAAESISCLAKQANITPPPLSGLPDGYIRDQTVCRALKGNGLKMTVYEYPQGSGNWFPESENSTNQLASFTLVPGTNNKMVLFNTSTPQYRVGVVQPCYVLAQLDPNTGLRVVPAVVGPKGSHQPDIVSTDSCMWSLAH